MARVDAAVRFAMESPAADPELVFLTDVRWSETVRGVSDMAKKRMIQANQ